MFSPEEQQRIQQTAIEQARADKAVTLMAEIADYDEAMRQARAERDRRGWTPISAR